MALTTSNGQGLEMNQHVGRSSPRLAFGCTANRLVSGVCTHDDIDSVICRHTVYMTEWAHHRYDQPFQ